jgi:uncharacterized membrane protein YedE/YeeE
MDKEFKKDLDALKDSLKQYLQLQLDMQKLSLIEKLSGFGAYVLKITVVIYFSLLIAGFFLGALAVWFGRTFNNFFAGVLIAGAALLVVAVLLILLRKKIAVNTALSNLSKILLNDEEK